MKFAGAFVLAIPFAVAARAQEEVLRDDVLVAEKPSALAQPVVFVGKVVTTFGRPARGAVVTSSAGGEAVADGEGRFELAAEVPEDAQEVELSAVVTRAKLGRTQYASTRVLPAALTATTSVGTLRAAPDSGYHWQASFGGVPGVSDPVLCMTVFDDGTGPALYVGGLFRMAGGVEVRRVARWDGQRWSALGKGIDVGSSVDASCVFDDGSGAALYVAGEFSSAGGSPASNIARWDGASWSALGNGLSARARALCVFDDGSGPALYAAGHFSAAGTVSGVAHIARWDGSSWSAVGSGLPGGTGVALVVHDDGSGPALYAGGTFTTPGSRIARWDGTSWSQLGAGLDDNVYALASFDSGSGAQLYAGGRFDQVGKGLARWNGSSWSDVAGGIAGPFGPEVDSLRVLDAGGGASLYATGRFASAGGVAAAGIARWNGTSWSAVGDGLHEDTVAAVGVFDSGAGPELYVGGWFPRTGSSPARGIARLTGSRWSVLGRGVAGEVQALVVGDDGSGVALYAGGSFGRAPYGLASVARWNGSRWSTLGEPMPGSVNALAFFDDGAGPELYAGGFLTTGGVATGIARWDGTQWSAEGPNPPSTIYALCVFDDGSGPQLFAGAYGAGVSVWNGHIWQNISFGAFGTNQVVMALCVFDDGNGPALYAGGSFTNHVRRWTGSGWAALTTGVPSTVNAMTVFDDGSGPALYVAGERTGTTFVAHVRRWNGTSWTTLTDGGQDGIDGTGGHFFALTEFDDGTGPALYAGGDFRRVGQVAARCVAKWDGASWSPLGAGVSSMVRAFAGLDGGSGRVLILGGAFDTSPAKDSFVAGWGPTPRAEQR